MTTVLEPSAPTEQESRRGRRGRRGRPRVPGRLTAGRAWLAARLRALWRWARRGPKGRRMPGVYRSRRLAAPRVIGAWLLIGAAVAMSVHSEVVSARKARPPAPVEQDRGAGAAWWAAVNWRDHAALGQTPFPVAAPVNEGGGYWRVTLDRGNRAGCVELGVIDAPAQGTDPGGYRFAGDLPAPVGCPPDQAAAPAAGDDLVGDLRDYVTRFLGDYMAGRPLDLYTAPGVTVPSPSPASSVRVESMKVRHVPTISDGGALFARVDDVTVTFTADQGAGTTRFALRVLVRYRDNPRLVGDGKPEVVGVKGGAFVSNLTPSTLAIPPVTTTTVPAAPAAASSTTTTARPPTTSSSSPPPVTVAPTATTVPSSPPAPAQAGA